MNAWSIVRFALLAVAFLQGAFVSQSPVSPEEVSLWPAFRLFGFGILCMLFVVGIQRINPFSAPSWRYPSWFINPFLFREPLQFFHLAGFSMLATSAGTLVRMLFVEPLLWFSALSSLAFGAGILGGVYACTFVYRGKMERT